MGVCTKERKGETAEVLMATPGTNSLGGESGGQKHEGCGGRRLCWKFAIVSCRERAAVNVDVGPERRSPRYHESCHVMILFSRGGDVMWVMFRGSFPGMIISER